MDSSRKILDAFGLSYFGTYVDAYYSPNENNNVVLKKRPIMPNRKTREINRTFCDNVWDSNYMIKRKPNLWAVDTKRSNISTIDIDQPDKCDILDHLIKKCKFYVKTRKGYHFYFKYNDTIAKKISEFNENKHTALCNTVDFNTDLLFFGGKYNVSDEVYTA